MKNLEQLKLKTELLLEELQSVKSDTIKPIENQDYRAVILLQEKQKITFEKLRTIQTELFSLKGAANKQDAKEIQALLDKINS